MKVVAIYLTSLVGMVHGVTTGTMNPTPQGQEQTTQVCTTWQEQTTWQDPSTGVTTWQVVTTWQGC